MNLHSFFQTSFGPPPNYKFLKVFGCLYFPYIRPYNNHKLQYRSIQCLFLGYSSFQKGYICMDLTTSHIYISKHIVFDDTVFPYHIPQPLPNPTISPQTITPAIPSFTSNSHTSTTSNTFHPKNMPSSPTNSSASINPFYQLFKSHLWPTLCRIHLNQPPKKQPSHAY